jgi:hypothetical protein
MGRLVKFKLRGLLVLAGMIPMLGSSGCITAYPLPLPPLPIPAWTPDRIEERLLQKNDNRTPVMPPIPPGFTPKCEDPPDIQTILRAMPRVARGVMGIYEEFRDDMEFVREKLVDHVDPPRFYPLIGWAQLHHCHWKVTVYYTETITVGYPIPFRTVKRRVEAIYLDQDHLHPFVYGEERQREVAREYQGPPP